MFVCFCLFFIRLRFLSGGKGRNVKFCMSVRLLSGQVFSHFGELWLAGVTAVALLPGCSRNWPPWYEHSELGAAALLKVVWWDLRLVSLLTHLFNYLIHLPKSDDIDNKQIYACYTALRTQHHRS